MAANNAYRQREAELSVKRLAVQDVPPASTLDCFSGSSKSVHSLAEKIQNGFKVKCVFWVGGCFWSVSSVRPLIVVCS